MFFFSRRLLVSGINKSSYIQVTYCVTDFILALKLRLLLNFQLIALLIANETAAWLAKLNNTRELLKSLVDLLGLF